MSLSFLCGLFGYTRQAYYKHLRRNREGSLSDTLLLERVGYYRKLMPRLGGALYYNKEKVDKDEAEVLL